ncbi:MAG: antitoxin [Candidatus Omnitrophota bacterium]
MKKVKLNAEEKEISDAIDQDVFVPVTGKQLEDVADAIASRKKDSSLTIRVNSRDISRIKKMAAKKGIAYQTYIAEVIHQVAESLNP